MPNVNGEWIMLGTTSNSSICLKSVEQLEALVDSIGFLPLFANGVKGFSVEERTIAKSWWSGDAAKDPWEWRAIVAERGNVAYGKFFDKKAGFISKKWLPMFANARRDGYDFDARWDDEKAQLRQKKIMDLFVNGERRMSYDVKQLAGFCKDGEKNFDGVLTELQMETYLCVSAFKRRKNKAGEEYGWAVAEYATPETLWGYDLVASGYKDDPKHSAELIRQRLCEMFPDATPREMNKILSLPCD